MQDRKLKIHYEREYTANQDGGVGRHTMPPRTTRTDGESTARGSDTKEIQNKHSSRPVGGADMGTGVERTHVAVAGLRLAECGTNGALADPEAPHFHTDKLRGPDS